MARYIDAELALELHNGELWAWDVPDLKEFLAEVPTAHVVPKSEVDFLHKTMAENAQRALEVTLEEIENAKTEVARKIFEEIEREIKNHGITYAQRKIAELKKKYTEEKE